MRLPSQTIDDRPERDDAPAGRQRRSPSASEPRRSGDGSARAMPFLDHASVQRTRASDGIIDAVAGALSCDRCYALPARRVSNPRR